MQEYIATQLMGINHINLPEKLIQQYEKTITSLEDEVKLLKSLLER